MCSFYVKLVFQGYIYKHSPTFAPTVSFEVRVKAECTKNENTGQLHFKKYSENQVCGYQRQRVQRKDGLDEGDHKVQTSNYKIDTFWEYNGSVVTIILTVPYI